ncbi:MAG: hypothetical protein AMJ60_06210 [Desulfobacterales bacterium SG8_35]|nr:MAG: hypothetical protein AMJ60_06210 [Desulfobacterales bacterium SG8_35]
MKKVLKWAGYVALAIAIFLLAVFLNRESLSYYTLRKGAQFYAGRADIALAFGRVGGNIFSETTLENISIRPVDGQPQTYHFKAQSISCTYNIWDLKEGYELFLHGLSCTTDAPEFAYEFRVATSAEQPAEEPARFLVPAMLPALDLKNGTVVLTNEEWDILVRGINANLRSAAAAHELQLEVESFRFNQEGMARTDTGFVSLLHYGEEKLSIDSLRIGEEQISATGFIDLSRMDTGYFEFAADMAFTESQLGLKGSLANRLLQVDVGTESFDVGELQKRLGGLGWDISGKIRGKADLAVNLATLEDPAGSFAVNVIAAQLRGVNVETLAAAGSFDSDYFRISTAEANTPGNHVLVRDVSVSMPLLLAGKVLPIIGGSKAEFAVDVADFATLLQLIKADADLLPEVVSPNSLTMTGSLEKGALYLEAAKAVASYASIVIDRGIIPIPATAEAFESVPVNIAARFESRNLGELAGLLGDIPLQGQAAAEISVAGSIREPKARIDLSGEYLGFKEMQLGGLSLQGDVQLSQEKLGAIKAIKFEIIEMTQENESGILALLSPIAGTWQDDTFSMDGAFKLDGKGEIFTGISRSPGKEIAVEISTRNLDSDGWLRNFIDARYFFHGADIEAVLKGVPESTQMQVSGTVSEAGGTNVPFPLTGSFGLQYSSKGIEISEFTWKSLERNQLTLAGHLPYDPMADEPFLDGEMSLKGHIDFPALEDIGVFLEPWGIGTGSVALDFDVSGSWDRPEGHVHFQAEGIEPPGTLKQYMDSAVVLSCDIAALGGSIVLQAASLDSSAYTAQATGSWKHGISVKELLQNRRAELKGEVKADATMKLKDLNFLRTRLPWLRRLEGDMQGELHLAGPVTRPALKGSFSLKDGEASHTFNFPMLSAVNLKGDFDEQSITIKDMQAEVGGSPVSLQGKISKEKDTVDVNLHADGKNVLLFRNNDMRMRGDVQLDVSGPLERLVIKGTTGLTGGYYTKNFDFLGMIGSSSVPVSEGVNFLFSFQDPPLRDAVLDIRITTIEPFRIRNNLIRGVLRPELTLKGTGELPFLVGAVYIDPSRVVLPSGRLQVQSGLLRFLEGEPDRPQFDLLAQSKILGYDINVVISGTIDDPVITLSSSPSLPNDELLLLLLTGQPPKEDAAGGAKGRGTTNVMVYLGRDFLNKWLEDESGASDESILDRFELDYGRNITKSGEQTVEATFRLSEYTAGTGKIYYLSGEKDKYDAYNYGFRLVFRFE